MLPGWSRCRFHSSQILLGPLGPSLLLVILRNRYGMGIWSESSIPIRTTDGHIPAKIETLKASDVYKSFMRLKLLGLAMLRLESSPHVYTFSSCLHFDHKDASVMTVGQCNECIWMLNIIYTVIFHGSMGWDSIGIQLYKSIWEYSQPKPDAKVAHQEIASCSWGGPQWMKMDIPSLVTFSAMRMLKIWLTQWRQCLRWCWPQQRHRQVLDTSWH